MPVDTVGYEHISRERLSRSLAVWMSGGMETNYNIRCTSTSCHSHEYTATYDHTKILIDSRSLQGLIPACIICNPPPELRNNGD